jgi:NAD-dependent dihydropyrimidine dehydrogenase PreA subunit
MKIMRKIIQIDEALCDGCGNCVVGCAEGALKVINGKAKVVADKFCDGLGACIGECPTGALKIIEREAEAFDEAAVEAHLSGKEEAPRQPVKTHTGCPSAAIHTFAIASDRSAPGQTDCAKANQPATLTANRISALSQWPIQIRLIPPTAPFLNNSDLLVLADCSAVTLPYLHEDFIRGRVVMMGCPKFDDAKDYQERFRQIFSANTIRSITVLRMEVPCCSGLPMIVERALKESKKTIPLEEVVVGVRGDILETKKVA